MEHTIYLAAGDFIKAVGPKTKTWNKSRTASVEDDDEDDKDEEDWAADWNKLDLLPDEQAVDDEVDFTAGDMLGKALALVNQVTHFFFSISSFLRHIIRSVLPRRPRLILQNAVLKRIFQNWNL